MTCKEKRSAGKGRQERQIASVREKISFGLGDFAINGMFTFVSSYLLYFYTDSVRLGLEAGGVILFLGRMADAFICIIAGNVVDRVDTRFGKCRPFLMAGIFPMTVMMCVLFFMPDISDTKKLVYGCMIYVVFSVIYAFVNVPYSTMLSLVTTEKSERVSFNVYKNIGGNAGALFVTLFTLQMTDMLGGARNSGYLKTALLYAVFFLAGGMICVWNTKERKKKTMPGTRKECSWRESFRVAVKNRNWIIFIIIQFTGMLYMIIHNQGTFYYTKYYLECEKLNTVLLSLTPLLCVLCAFVLPILEKKIGMRKLLIYGHAIVGFSLIGTLAAGENIGAVVACGVLTSLGWSIATGMIFVMLTRLIDWSESESGLRPQGFMTSWMTFFMKMGVAAAGYVVPKILEWGGYVAGSPAAGQAIHAIRMNFIWIPAILAFSMAVLAVTCRIPEDIDKKK